MKKYILLSILTLPVVISANAGTPLLWTAAVHLYFGNFLIAAGEAAYLRNKITGLNYFVALIFMVIANYLSMGLGTYCAYEIGTVLKFDFFSPKGNLNYSLQHILYYLGFTLSSMVIELPFIKLLAIDIEIKKVIKMAVFINSISALSVIVLSLLFHVILYGFVF
ncbi:MAG: hypothetical protein OCC49_19520 [Fibrobacterales bacterium]